MVKILGISGYARSGKDTFAKYAREILLEKDIALVRFAFADKLKANINQFLVQKLGISANTRSDYEKKIIRPLLVGYGESARLLNKDYWINELKESMTAVIGEKLDGKRIIPVITDVRYVNELLFIKELGGKAITIRQPDLAAANNEELINQKEVDEKSDFILTWPKFGDDNLDDAKNYVKDALSSIGL